MAESPTAILEQLDKLVKRITTGEIIPETDKQRWLTEFARLIDRFYPSNSVTYDRLKRILTPSADSSLSAFKKQFPKAMDIPLALNSTKKKYLNRFTEQSLDLIKLNRKSKIAELQGKFANWLFTHRQLTGEQKQEGLADLRKSFTSLAYEDRRVAIDQGRKLARGLDKILAEDHDAIGGIWLSNYKARGYNYRQAHKERHGKFYIVRGSSADKRKWIKGTYMDEIDLPEENINCQCKFAWVYALKDVPEKNLTADGRKLV